MLKTKQRPDIILSLGRLFYEDGLEEESIKTIKSCSPQFDDEKAYVFLGTGFKMMQSY